MYSIPSVSAIPTAAGLLDPMAIYPTPAGAFSGGGGAAPPALTARRAIALYGFRVPAKVRTSIPRGTLRSFVRPWRY